MKDAVLIQLPPAVRELMQQLRRAGFSAYAVGGCVRDSLLGKAAVDWDMTTSALPAQIKAVFEGYKTVDIGISHGTVGVVKDGCVYEITTFRTDGVYTDSRHPDSVTFTPSLSEDLKRRDFTVNAMAYSEEDGLVDLFSGREDLQKRIIRTVGDPRERFAEDALRILRGARFAATLGFSIEENTLSAMHQKAPALAYVSAERKKEEIGKMLCGKNASAVVLQNAAVIACAWQGIFFSQIQANAPLLDLVPPELPLRLAAFFDTTAPSLATRLLSEYRFDKKTAVLVGEILSAKSKMPCKTPPDFSRLLGKYGASACFGALDLLVAQSADFAVSHKETFTRLLETDACVKVSQLKLDGKALLPYVQGREVGRVLDALLEAVINEKTENEESALLSYAKSHLL